MKTEPYKNYKAANAVWLSAPPKIWKQIRGRFVMAINPENDKIVTRYMDDSEFQRTAFPILAKEIFEEIRRTQQEKR